MFWLHVAIFVWLVRVEMLLFRIKRMGDDVALVEALLRVWAIDGDWSPEMKRDLLRVLKHYEKGSPHG